MLVIRGLHSRKWPHLAVQVVLAGGIVRDFLVLHGQAGLRPAESLALHLALRSSFPDGLARVCTSSRRVQRRRGLLPGILDGRGRSLGVAGRPLLLAGEHGRHELAPVFDGKLLHCLARYSNNKYLFDNLV